MHRLFIQVSDNSSTGICFLFNIFLLNIFLKGYETKPFPGITLYTLPHMGLSIPPKDLTYFRVEAVFKESNLGSWDAYFYLIQFLTLFTAFIQF